ncbi:hypothetical protein R52603_01945 [Paraburkholderia saeva]|nr:hypothetical protein R52603_01945 [Paraburkholderia saeva]CAG4905411.1 hypothetical protein R70241_03303 [Paraburkholderia saeva]
METRLQYQPACQQQAPRAHAVAAGAVNSSWPAVTARPGFTISLIAPAAISRMAAARHETVDTAPCNLRKGASSQRLVNQILRNGREAS